MQRATVLFSEIYLNSVLPKNRKFFQVQGDPIIIFISLKIIILLLAVNAAPPVIAFLLEDGWNWPIDWNRTFLDGKPLLGRHKTIRGTIGSIAAGTLLSGFLGHQG